MSQLIKNSKIYRSVTTVHNLKYILNVVRLCQGSLTREDIQQAIIEEQTNKQNRLKRLIGRIPKEIVPTERVVKNVLSLLSEWQLITKLDYNLYKTTELFDHLKNILESELNNSNNQRIKPNTRNLLFDIILKASHRKPIAPGRFMLNIRNNVWRDRHGYVNAGDEFFIKEVMKSNYPSFDTIVDWSVFLRLANYKTMKQRRSKRPKEFNKIIYNTVKVATLYELIKAIELCQSFDVYEISKHLNVSLFVAQNIIDVLQACGFQKTNLMKQLNVLDLLKQIQRAATKNNEFLIISDYFELSGVYGTYNSDSMVDVVSYYLEEGELLPSLFDSVGYSENFFEDPDKTFNKLIKQIYVVNSSGVSKEAFWDTLKKVYRQMAHNRIYYNEYLFEWILDALEIVCFELMITDNTFVELFQQCAKEHPAELILNTANRSHLMNFFEKRAFDKIEAQIIINGTPYHQFRIEGSNNGNN